VPDPSLDSSLTSIIYSTIQGDSVIGDAVTAMAADASGRVWAAGSAGKGHFHGKVRFGHKTCTDKVCGNEAFVVLIDPTKSHAASLVYSAAIAGNGADAANAIALDTAGTVYIGGSTSSSNFPVTYNAVQSQYIACSGCAPYRAAAFICSSTSLAVPNVAICARRVRRH